MRRFLCALALLGLAVPSPARADGFLVPTDRSLPPLSLTHQRVRVDIDGQVATTSVEQVYRNSTSRDLEAEYLFPLPAGATVREFAMWVGGKRLTGETLDAPKARKTYEDIVRRLQDPGLLEYVDRDLWKVRIYPVPRQGEQKIEIKFTTLLPRDGEMVAYTYPLKTGKAPRRTERDFTLVVKLKSDEALGPIYSPSHDVAVNRKGDREAVVSFEHDRYTLDRDFNLYFAPKSKDVGLSLLAQRPSHERQGYFLLLLSPRADADEKSIPRDLVVVLDTSHSMTGEKLRQAKGALKSALNSLKADDRFALIQFATVVTPFRDGLSRAGTDEIAAARDWVETLEAQGATDIGSALDEALKLRPSRSEGRTFQVVFFTDGLPTAGDTSEQILKAAKGRDLGSARVFTFGVGDDVDAHLLDQLAESSRAASTYVRPGEDLEQRASSLVAKISHPVRTDLKLRAGEGVRLVEMYPPHLPDLFRGEQLQVAGRYEGDGHVALTLESRVGDRSLSDTYEVRFPRESTEHDFIAPIWARRKVGYLLDQIRLHGEKGELRDEVTRLAREFGIATPYTSLLIVPDERPGLVRGQPMRRGMHLQSPGPGITDLGAGAGGGYGGNAPLQRGTQGRMAGRSFNGLKPGQAGQGLDEKSAATGVTGPSPAPPGAGFARTAAARVDGETLEAKTDALGVARRSRDSDLADAGVQGQQGQQSYRQATGSGTTPAPTAREARPVGEVQQGSFAGASDIRHADGAVSGREAIDLAQHLASLKSEDRASQATTVKTLGGRTFRQFEGVWVDDRFDPSLKTLALRAFGAGYFRLLERHPEVKAILALGDRVVWVAPSGVVLVIDKDGRDEVPDGDLDRLFDRPATK